MIAPPNTPPAPLKPRENGSWFGLGWDAVMKLPAGYQRLDHVPEFVHRAERLLPRVTNVFPTGGEVLLTNLILSDKTLEKDTYSYE